uniref:NADH dehydrogenase (Ubiquinone) Fe-S protein 6 n=1 Tax=Kwoniella pini CBS 10737 TaxID=1296096 RepID=A0A1B9IE81_9TREE|nr:NADH dehydrogenase (ubiquinone) Fe-S protein 6 [Kwoniella pini CBS 10737]OCF53885.1 NADH dehydrogenase (ubiquinone) Fe-S protein 6 [Kwoniella pini CBS 10737]
MSVLRSVRILPRNVSAIRTYASIPQPSDPVPSKQPSSSSPPTLQQSPNIPTTWSTGQNPKPHAYDNQRFEQTALQFQPNPQSAMGMVNKDPVRLVNGRRAVCDGGE